MYASPFFVQSPSGHASYGYRPSPSAYYPKGTPTKGHTRRASHEPQAYVYATPPPKTGYWAPPSYAPGAYYTTAPMGPPKRAPAEFVSGSERLRAKAAAHRFAADLRSSPSKSRHHSYHAHYVYDEDEGYYSPGGSPPPPYPNEDSYHHRGYWRADEYYHDPQASHYRASADRPPRYRPSPRARASSQPMPPNQDTPSKSRPSTAKPHASPEATAADAAAAGIPAGYSLKNWDPTEEPILLLGSVFDANTLGRWIYDWTVFHHGPSTPMADLAGDLWLLLIQLASKIKRAEETSPRIRRHEDQDLVEEFLESGERLWSRFGKILKVCEDYMWKSAKRSSKSRAAKGITMGPESGCEFVDSIFGRDRQLESTEQLMTGMRLWSMRFDANCDEILRKPGA